MALNVLISPAPNYPIHWWQKITEKNIPQWEILPQEAKPGEVILSKRNELGLLSNFAATPFTYRGKRYASVEGFWQATKYPEDKNDPRMKFKDIHWAHTRAEVEAMTAFEAKEAGNLAEENMKKMNINWVTFEKKKMVYREPGDSSFYRLVVNVMKAKLKQNLSVKNILLQTGDLKLRPDHKSETSADLKAWQYHEIWMQLRTRLK